MRDLSYIAPGADTGAWKARHTRAVRRALQYSVTSGPIYEQAGYPIVRAVQAWIEYAEAHKARYESDIGGDYVLGPAWEQWGRALRTLLNGETGDLDCGTLDSIILHNLVEQGFTEEGR